MNIHFAGLFELPLVSTSRTRTGRTRGFNRKDASSYNSVSRKLMPAHLLTGGGLIVNAGRVQELGEPVKVSV